MYDLTPQRAVLRAWSQECTPKFRVGHGVSLGATGPPADRILYEKIRSARPEVCHLDDPGASMRDPCAS